MQFFQTKNHDSIRINRFGPCSRFAISLAAIILSGHAAASATNVPLKLQVIGPAPTPAFIDAAQKAGCVVGPAPNADITLVETPFVSRDQTEKQVYDTVVNVLLAGKTVIVAFQDRPSDAEVLEPILPVNFWSISGGKGQRRNLKRLDTGAIVPDGSPFADIPNWNTFQISSHYDLHLPYSLMEAGEHRYSWQTMDKGLLNTDWKVLLRCSEEGQLPLLIQSRLGPGTTMVYGGDIFDPALSAWSGYSAFIQQLIKSSAPDPATGAALPPGIKLSIPRWQPAGLSVQIANPSNTDADAILCYKVSNSEHALLNSASTDVNIPAGKTVTVPLAERSDEWGDPAITASADRAVPYRFIQAGIAPNDRSSIVISGSTMVDTAGPVGVSIEGQDIRSFPDMKTWPDREMFTGWETSGGAPIYRHIYWAGQTPDLSVTLRNGLHNLSPLAVPADLNWPENPSVQGLNDLAFSQGNLRGTYPLFGYWSGKSAADQNISLTWNSPVLIAGQTIAGQIPYRGWDRSNPTNYETLFSGPAGEEVATTVKNAVYTNGSHTDTWAPATTTALRLHVTGLDPNASLQPRAFADDPAGKGISSNCAITEWEVNGWPSANPPAPADGTLIVTVTQLQTGKTTELIHEKTALAPLTKVTKSIQLPTMNAYGEERVDATYTTVDGNVLRDSFAVQFVEAAPEPSVAAQAANNGFDAQSVAQQHPVIMPDPKTDMGLLCSPGFLAFNDFGMGTMADTQGWGGPDDKIWALTHDFMELGTRNIDESNRMFTTSARFCHYTCPWRDFPSGQYFWDWGATQLEDGIKSGRFKGNTLHIFLSDRWNGIPVGATFTWADFIDFDQYLRATQGHGLIGRSRKQIIDEITSQYGDVWQEWQMNRYADQLIDVQNRLAKLGVKFTVTTHGGFPFVGGELGAKIAETHIASGTDLFWELQNEDLYYSIGHRFGLVAANPNYESGAYNEWGWCSSTLNNSHWYAYTGSVEPARRQWYGTYFAGRVTTEGLFAPFTDFGYYAQGGFGVKNTDNDWQKYYNTMSFTNWVRPEKATGFGLVVSWPEQKRHMGKKAGVLGCGLYAAAGYDQVDSLAGDVYSKLVKDGIPIGFVANTNSLVHWTGNNPLILVDGMDLEKWEINRVSELNKSGAPIIAIGGSADATPETTAFFGVKKGGEDFTPLPGTRVIESSGHALAFITQKDKRGGTLFCPFSGKELSDVDATHLAQAIQNLINTPLSVTAGTTVTPFISHNRLFLAMGNEGDENHVVTVSVNPAAMGLANLLTYHVVEVDDGDQIPFKQVDGNLIFDVPTAATDGRMIAIGE